MGVGRRILKNGRLRWYIQYKVDGKWFTETVPARNEKEAHMRLGEKLGDIKKGRIHNLAASAKITLSKWAEKYLVIKENQGTGNMRRVRLSVKILNAHFGKRKLQEIKPSDVEAFKAKMLKTASRKCPGHNLSGATVNRLVAQLRNMYMVAKREGIIETNPVCGIKFEKEHGRNIVISDVEFEKLLSKCPYHLYGIVLMGWEIGMKKSEITSLTWDGVNLETGLKPENTKTDEPRDIPISPRLKECLSRLPRSRKFNNVFLFRGKPIDDFKTAWAKVRKEAGIEHFWFHDLRRCFITRMRRMGVDNYTTRAITGHKTESAFKCYQAIEESDLTKAVEKLSGTASIQRDSEKVDECDASS